MFRRIGGRATVAMTWLIGSITVAGFEPNTFVYKSSAQEASSTHVLVGTIRSFHQLRSDSTRPPGTGGPMNRFVAEMDVAKVEKGQGIRSGDRIYVRFHSPSSIEDVSTPFPGFGCGQVDLRVTPGPGEPARIYIIRDDDYQYVADYPQSFFRIRKKELEDSGRNILNVLRPGIFSLAIVGVTIGLAIGFLAGRLFHRPKADESTIDLHPA